MKGCAPSSSTSLMSSRITAMSRIVRQLNPRASAIGLEVRAEKDAMQVNLATTGDDRNFGQNGQVAKLGGHAIEGPPGILEQDGVLASMGLRIEPVVVLINTRKQTRDVRIPVPEANQ